MQNSNRATFWSPALQRLGGRLLQVCGDKIPPFPLVNHDKATQDVWDANTSEESSHEGEFAQFTEDLVP